MNDRVLTKLQKAKEDILSGNTTVPAFPTTPSGLISLRKSLGLTQNQFAERMCVSVDTIKSWESGRRKPGKQSQLVAKMALS